MQPSGEPKRLSGAASAARPAARRRRARASRRRARGLPGRTQHTKHTGRATLTPVMTVFGLDIGTLLGGAIITETVFNIQGIGKLALNSLTNSDLPMIMATVLVAAIFIVVANIVVDVLYAVVDPRVRLA